MAKSKNSKDLSDKDTAPETADGADPAQVSPETGTTTDVDADGRKDSLSSETDTTETDTVEGAAASEVAGTQADTIADDAEPVVQVEPGTGPDVIAQSDAEPDADRAVAGSAASDPTGHGPLFPHDPGLDAQGDDAGAAPVPPQVIKETVVQKKAGFFPMLVGGVIAAGAGFLAAQYESNDWPFAAGAEDPFRSQTEAALQSQQGAVDDLVRRLGSVEGTLSGFDAAAVQGSVSDLSSQVAALGEQVSGLSDQIGLLEVRMVAVEKAPIADTVSPEAIAAYERELAALRSDIAQQRSEIENMAAEAMAAEGNAAEQAALARARAALATLTSALDNGQPFAEAVGMISASDDITVPTALSAVSSDGVPTQTELANAFPDAARAGLSAVRETQAEGGGVGLGSFLRDQLGARSVTPRDGDDADAVLSRAEAAVKAGDLAAALSEIETLPEVAQTAMAGWVSQAQVRLQAQAAAAELSQELNKQ